MHPHDNLEIVTLVFEGALAHNDSFGHDERMGAGTLQAITAGRGIQHEEKTADGAETLGVEILLRPRTRDAEPRRSVGQFPCGTPGSGFVVCASGRDQAPASALPIDQDASVCVASAGAGERVRYTLEAGRRGYVLSTRGAIVVEGTRAEPGDRVLLEGGGRVTIEAVDETCVLLIDLP
jgi:redox-sensitive bicupin YhaK (pirin superfamily)